jgi:hypothetical protein
MRLTVNNIRFVKAMTHKESGIIYAWYVGMKSGYVSDGRSYINCENGKTVIREYPVTDLPKAVQTFVNTHSSSLFDETENVSTMIYR